MKKKTKWILGIAAIVIIIAAVFTVRYLQSVKAYQNAVEAITYQNQNADGIPDGVYTGECDVDFIYARVSVTVQNEEITKIDLLEHRNERGAAAEGIEQKIVEQQKIDVDAVAGATNSGKVIKKAVDNALAGG